MNAHDHWSNRPAIQMWVKCENASLERAECFNWRGDIVPYIATCIFALAFGFLFIFAVSFWFVYAMPRIVDFEWSACEKIFFQISQHTFHLIKSVRNISIKTQNLHRILTRSLVVQVGIIAYNEKWYGAHCQALLIVVIIIVPFGTLMLVNNYLAIPIYFQIMEDLGMIASTGEPASQFAKISGIDILDVLVLVLSFHATFHAISLLVTTPAFRNKFFEVWILGNILFQ